MSDTLLDFGTTFDTVVEPAGDASIVSDALSASNGVDTSVPSVGDVGQAASSAPETVPPIDSGPDLTPPVSSPADTADPGANTDSGIAPGEQAKPPATPDFNIKMQDAPNVQVPAPEIPGGGPLDSVDQWAKDHPGQAGIIGNAMKVGGAGAMTFLALRNKMEAAKEEEERKRQDVIRRGQVQALPPGTFTPKPGIINRASGG